MSHINILDYGIDDDVSSNDGSENNIEIEADYLTIKNPFFNRNNIIINNNYLKLIDLNHKEFCYNFSKIYVLCLKSDNSKINENIYNDDLTMNDLNNLTLNFDLIKSNIKLLNNTVHKSQVVLVDSYYLKLFNSTYEYDEKELVIPLINITRDTYEIYVKQYTAHFQPKDYFSIKIANDFYKTPYPNINYISEILKNLETSNYWTKNINTKLNITNKFINRGFNLTVSQRVTDLNIKDVLTELNKMPVEGGDAYLGYIYRKDVYVDASSVIKKKGYSLYKINEDIDLQSKDIDYILNTIKSKYEFYILTMVLLSSRDYCHLVINNNNYMNKLENWVDENKRDKIPMCNNCTNLINTYPLAFQYALSYTWLTFYIEECIKKTRIEDEDRFVFTIDQASKLPFYPISTNVRYNPYLTLLISNNVVNLNANIMGVELDNTPLGVVSFLKFRENFNIFMTSDKNVDILDNVDMKNLGISGSVIPACITKHNPLMTLFPSLDRYYKEYYCSSDIDVMCNIKDDFEYIDRVNKLNKEISNNCYKKFKESTVKFTNIKIAALIINEGFIRKNIVNKDNTYEDIISNLNNEDIKLLFYKYYIEFKQQENQKYFDSDKWKNETYNIFFDIVNVSNLRIVFARTKKDWDKYWDIIKNNKKSEEQQNAKDELEEIEKDEDSNEFNDNILFKCHENIKYNIKSSFLNHDIEIFKTRYSGSFFSTVSKFHLPCVRGYFSGDNVLLLPSCITAAMTLINIDYKYFAGSKDPIEIINKYRQRGYSLPLNDSEKIRFTSYSAKVEKWKILYGNYDYRNKNSINKIFGYLSKNSDFFKPRLVLAEYYTDLKPVDLINVYKNENQIDTILNNKQLIIKTYPILKNDFDNIIKVCNLEVINKYGYINYIKKWYFDAIFENTKFIE